MASIGGANQTEYSDFSTDTGDELVVQKRAFFVNAAVLADLSPFFRQLFFDDSMQKKKDGQAAEIKDEQPDDILELLHCLLQSSDTRLKPKPITVTNFSLLVRLAVKYEIASLFARCEHYILHKFRSEMASESALLGVLQAVDSARLRDECRVVALERAKKNVSTFTLKCYDFTGWDPNLVAVVTTAILKPNESVLASVGAKENVLPNVDDDGYSEFALETPFTTHQLIVEEKTLLVNGAELANRSAFFARMFFGDGDFKEKVDQKVIIEDETHSDILELLQCSLMNSKSLKKIKPVAVANCATLIRLADKFHFPSLTAACERFVQLRLKQQRNVSDDQLVGILTNVIMHRLSPLSLNVVIRQSVNASTFPKLVRLASEQRSAALTTACELFIASTFPSITVSDQTALAMLASAAVYQLSSATTAKLIDRVKTIGQDVLQLIDFSHWPGSVASELWLAKIKHEKNGPKHRFDADSFGGVQPKRGRYDCSTTGCQYNRKSHPDYRSVLQCTQCSKYFCNECLAKAGNCTAA